MAQPDKIKKTIAEIAQRRKNVTLSEIEWVVNQLKEFYEVQVRTNDHATLFRIDQYRFNVCSHNPGEKQIKAIYVDTFLDVMSELGWYEE